MKRFILLGFLLIAAVSLQAQELTVKRMEVAPMDLSASTQQRLDKNRNPCALVKVLFPTVGVTFEGNVLGDVEFKAGEYWVYMSEGSYMLNVKHPNFYPLMVNFRDYDIRKVEGKTTYVLTLAVPVQMQKLTVNYTPLNAIVLIDSKPYQGNGHLELELPVGSHDYQIVAMGYETAEGSVKLTAGSPRIVTEYLVATAQQTAEVQQPVQSIIQQPVQQETSSSSATPFIETFTVYGVSFNMVRVEGGTFLMGSDDGSDDEKPVHKVTLSTYSIGETEVTQALWEAVMGMNPSHFKRKGGPNAPVEQVSWDDCQGFIQKLNQLTGKSFRLPTEAEWEYAARGGNKSFGYMYAGSNNANDVAWTELESDNRTHPVKTKQANELGLFDMSGNVREWCQDWYGAYGISTQSNPTGRSSGTDRVCRGGCAIYYVFPTLNHLRSSEREHYSPLYSYCDLGLRLAL